jgi:hypothetical protein
MDKTASLLLACAMQMRMNKQAGLREDIADYAENAGDWARENWESVRDSSLGAYDRAKTWLKHRYDDATTAAGDVYEDSFDSPSLLKRYGRYWRDDARLTGQDMDRVSDAARSFWRDTKRVLNKKVF